MGRPPPFCLRKPSFCLQKIKKFKERNMTLLRSGNWDIALLVVTCLGVPSEASASFRGAAAEELTITATTTSPDVTDLDFTIENSGGFTFFDQPRWSKGPFTHVDSNKINPTAGRIIFDGATLSTDTKVNIGFITFSKVNNFTLSQARWSFAGGVHTIISSLTDISLSCMPVGDPQNEFTISNNSDGYVAYTDLSFLSNTPELPLDAPVGTLPGFVTFDPFLLLAPGASADFLFPEIDPANYIYFEMASYVSDASGQLFGPAVGIRFGHQAPIPEPSTYVLLLGGFALLAGVGPLVRRRNERRFSAARCESGLCLVRAGRVSS
jgi:PEP-CTERM motif